MVYSAIYINEKGILPWVDACNEFTANGVSQTIIERISESKRSLGRHCFESQISKNLVDLVKKLEEVKFEDNPNYNDIAQDFENITVDKDA